MLPALQDGCLLLGVWTMHVSSWPRWRRMTLGRAGGGQSRRCPAAAHPAAWPRCAARCLPWAGTASAGLCMTLWRCMIPLPMHGSLGRPWAMHAAAWHWKPFELRSSFACAQALISPLFDIEFLPQQAFTLACPDEAGQEQVLNQVLMSSHCTRG